MPSLLSLTIFPATVPLSISCLLCIVCGGHILANEKYRETDFTVSNFILFCFLIYALFAWLQANLQDSNVKPLRSKGSVVGTWSDNKVRELAIVCLLWQQRTETSVWFDDIGISDFHN
jgi:hypothetical protein